MLRQIWPDIFNGQVLVWFAKFPRNPTCTHDPPFLGRLQEILAPENIFEIREKVFVTVKIKLDDLVNIIDIL